MSDNPQDVLRSQVEYWEGKAREAREQLRIAETVLPGLRESLERIRQVALRSGSAAQPTLASISPLPEARESPPENEESEAAPHPDLRELRTSEDVVRAIRSSLSDLSDIFTQNDVIVALERRGLFANRSTLRGNLQRLADVGEALRVAEPGRGRRATIFKKL